jgi:nitrite reductase/ring-hydroxylating ferredoxin subunit
MECTEEGCPEAAAVRLHIPWDETRVVCTGHARVYAQKDGIVADPLEAADEERP